MTDQELLLGLKAIGWVNGPFQATAWFSEWPLVMSSLAIDKPRKEDRYRAYQRVVRTSGVMWSQIPVSELIRRVFGEPSERE